MTDQQFWQDVNIRILPETLAELAAHLDAAIATLIAAHGSTDALCEVSYARGMVRHLQSRFPVVPEPEQLTLVLATVEG